MLKVDASGDEKLRKNYLAGLIYRKYSRRHIFGEIDYLLGVVIDCTDRAWNDTLYDYRIYTCSRRSIAKSILHRKYGRDGLRN